MSDTADAATVDPHFGDATTSKVAMWIFLLSDAITFVGLLLGYGILRAHHVDWPNPTDYLGINFTAGMTFLLICSSMTMVMSLAAAHENKKSQALFYLGLTILGGLLFLGGQVYEYSHLIHEKQMTLSGVHLPVPQFASTFYVITSFHGAHVTTGVIYLTVMFFGMAFKNKHLGDNTNGLELCGLFWHFVDLVWILVFTFIYLIE